MADTPERRAAGFGLLALLIAPHLAQHAKAASTQAGTSPGIRRMQALELSLPDTAASSADTPSAGPVPQGPAADVVGTRNVTWKELRQPCNGSELISWVRCDGPDCTKVFPGGTASPPPASPTLPAVIIQSTPGSAAADDVAAELPASAADCLEKAAAAGESSSDAVQAGANQQAEAQQVVATDDSAAAPAGGAASPPEASEASEGPQPSTGPATNDQPREQPGAAAPTPAVAPPAPGIMSAPPPPTADVWPVPFCQCQRICRDVKLGRYGRDANTSCRADSQHPNRWFIKLRSRTRVMCHNPVMPEIQAQKRRGKPVKPPPKKP